VLHAHSCTVRPGSGAIPNLGIPPTGDHPAGTEPGRSLQDRQKPAHPSSVSKINYVRRAADCLDRELSGRSPPAIWTPHANRRPSVSSSTPAKNTPLRCAILSDAFPPLLPLVIGQTRVRDFNWVGAYRGHRHRTHHVAAGDARPRAQLGLPLHLDGISRRPGRPSLMRSRTTSSLMGRQAGRLTSALRHGCVGCLHPAGSHLRIPAPDDEQLRASVLAIADELTEHGFVLRYRTGATDDGMSGKEGTFLICSFWLVSALAIIGDEQRART
jgi:hypothetical protein